MAQTVAAKLNIKPGMTVAVVAIPDGVDIELTPDMLVVADPSTADVVIAFVIMATDVDAVATPAMDAARSGRLAWIAYPKAKQLGTNLNRDSLARMAEERGATPVRQVAINDQWSALRFKPGGHETLWSPKK